MAKFDWIDESTLSHDDRLGLAYCRLNGWEWDPILGPKPEHLDVPLNSSPSKRKFGKKQQSAHDLIAPVIESIRSVIGEAKCSECWWRFAMGKTYEEWLRWYLVDRHQLSER